MTENKRFELKVNQRNQCDIIDWVESKEKNAICIYNDLGSYHFSSAKALCELLNELHEKNKELKEELKIYRKIASCSNCDYLDYNWFDDGDEFEICKRGNNEQQINYHICKDWREL